MKKKPIGLIIAVEVLAILILVLFIINKNSTKVESINPIKGASVSKDTSNYKSFYEPIANTNEVVNDWVYPLTYSINEDTLHERFEYGEKKKEGVFRIITLGDSWTYGLYVNTKDNWTEKLEDRLNSLTCQNINNFEVLNLGVHGYDISYSVERFNKRGKKYAPDLVIWLIKADDVVQVNEALLPEVADIEKGLKDTGEFERMINEGNNYASWNMAYKKVIDSLGKDNIYEMQKDYLNSIDYQGELLMVTFPESSPVGLSGENKELIEGFANSRQNTIFYNRLPDTHSIPKARFENDSHPNQYGHSLIADKIFEELKESHLSLCK